MKKIIIVSVLILGLFSISACQKQTAQEPIKIGWISSITGPVAKYGAYQAGILAVEEINNHGGVNGQPIQLIVEDGRCNSKAAFDAVNKLINIDKVKIIIGGHCTPESAAIAPVVEENKILMLASITTSPVLTNMGDYVFRTSPISTVQSRLMTDLAVNKLKLNKMAIVYEQTDYARPIAEKMKSEFYQNGGKVVIFEAYTPGVADFKTILTQAKQKQVDSIFISAQSPDSVLNFIKQVKEFGLDNVQLFGNDVAGIQANINIIPDLYENFILALPDFDKDNPKTKQFIDDYKNKYQVDNLPYGIWTAESYDGVMIIADALKKHGEDVEKIKEYLYNLKDYHGVSGTISIDANGDGIREYKLKIIRDGEVVDYE